MIPIVPNYFLLKAAVVLNDLQKGKGVDTKQKVNIVIIQQKIKYHPFIFQHSK